MMNQMTSHECRTYHPALDKIDAVKNGIDRVLMMLSDPTLVDFDKVANAANELIAIKSRL